MTERDYSIPGETNEFLVDPTRNLRYAELALVGAEFVSFYNSIGIHEAPPGKWHALDAEAAAAQLGIGMVVKNGPHWWASDTSRFTFGTEVLEVQGLGFRFASNLPVAVLSSGGLGAGKHYQPFDAAKNLDLVYRAGNDVYELVGPDAEVYLLQSTAAAMDDFDTLGERLTIPDGWEFRIRNLAEDLSFIVDGSVPTVMDDLGNVYNLHK